MEKIEGEGLEQKVKRKRGREGDGCREGGRGERGRERR